MNRIALIVFLTLAWNASAAISAPTLQTNVTWLPEMPTNIYQLFRATIENLPAPQGVIRTRIGDALVPTTNRVMTPTQKAALLARHLQTLESLRQISWPVLDGMERIAYRRTRASSSDTNSIETAWLIQTQPNRLIVLDNYFQVSELSTNWFTDLKRLNFKEELGQIFEFLGSTNVGARKAWPYYSLKYYHGQSQQYIADLFRLAYAAAWFGHTNEAVRLLQTKLRYDTSGDFFERIVVGMATTAYDDCMRLFDSGVARSELLTNWERFIKVYPQSPLWPQITNYAAIMRLQVAEFPKLVASTVENPETLPPPERAEYCLARFPDIPRNSSYPSYSYYEKEEHVDGKIIKIGYPAIPALIEHLSDRRLTRQTRYPYGRPRIILRVQDMALDCLQKITQVRFHITSGDVFSEAPVADREKLIAEVRAWWEKNGTKTPLEGQLAGLEIMPLNERLNKLRLLAEEHPGQVDRLPLLRKWTADPKNKDYKWLLAEPLAKLGDLSLLPAVRERLASGLGGPAEVLLRYGQAEDYAACRRAQWKQMAQYPFSTFLTSSAHLLTDFALNKQNALQTNWLAAPLLADLLELRQVAVYASDMGNTIECKADKAMGLLVRLTGHIGDYSTNTPLEKRMAATDAWLEWWEKEGQAQFMAKHPETKPVFIETPITPATLKKPPRDEMIAVRSANRLAPIIYDVPFTNVSALLTSGVIRGKAFGDTQIFRFSSLEAEEHWWNKTAQKILPPPSLKPIPCPAMHVQVSGGAWPDSSERVWTCWRTDSVWPAIFDGKRWRPFAETNLPPLLQGGNGFTAAITGTKEAMFFLNSESAMYLHDAEGWASSAKPYVLAREKTERVRRSLPSMPMLNQGPQVKMAKDADKNIWFIHLDEGLKVLQSDKLLALKWPDNSGIRLASDRAIFLAPLDKGKQMLAASGSGQRAVFTVKRGEIVKLKEFPTPFPISPIAPSFHDSRGWLWLNGLSQAIALNSEGEVVTNHPGRVLLEDRDKGVWFIETAATSYTTVCRWTPGQPELRLAVRDLAGPATLAPDDTVWLVLNQQGLVRVALKKDRLEVVESWTAPVSSRDTLWCDEAGRLWCAETRSYFENQLRCFPMRGK